MPHNPPHSPAWAIAAAILLIEDCAKHYLTLTSQVMNTGMSDLGASGGTPEKTLRADIANKHADIFEGHGGRSGYYQIGDKAAALASYTVQHSISRLIPVYLSDYLDRYKKKTLEVLCNTIDLADSNSEKTKLDIEQLEKQMSHLVRLYST